MSSSPPMWIIGLIVIGVLCVIGCCVYFLIKKSSSPSSPSGSPSSPSGSPSSQRESASSNATLTPGRTKDQGALYQSEADQQSIINQCVAKLGPGDSPAMCGTVRKVV